MDSSPAPKRRRARKPDGKFQGDNPSTPANEAWVAEDVSREVGEKTVDYSVKQKVSSTSSSTPGKYSQKPKVRPTFGKVHTTFN